MLVRFVALPGCGVWWCGVGSGVGEEHTADITAVGQGLLAEDGVEYAELRGVHISGVCEIVDDLRAVQDTLVDITGGEAASSAEAREGMYKVIEATAAKRVMLRIKPEKIVSWDHRKLEGKY